jgi:hypothetical protein
LFVSLTYLEVFGHVPLVRALVGLASDHIDRQMALVFLVFNLTTAIVFSVAQGGLSGCSNGGCPPMRKRINRRPNSCTTRRSRSRPALWT